MLEVYNTKFDLTVGNARLCGSPGVGHHLSVNGQRWMFYRQKTKDHLQMFSTYDLAYGDCIVTGLGTGVTANWLTANPRVNSILVVEKSKNVIQINKKLGLLDNPRIQVINEDANELKNFSCDCLLLDHYEHESFQQITDNVRSVASQNKVRTVWFWPIEDIIQRNLRLENPLDAYFNNDLLKDIPGLPKIMTEFQLKTYINLYYSSIIYQEAPSRKDFPEIAFYKV